MSSSDVELNGRVLPWMVLAATVCSTAGGILMTVAREPGRRRERSLVLGLSIVLNIVLFAVGMFLGLACKYIGV